MKLKLFVMLCLMAVAIPGAVLGAEPENSIKPYGNLYLFFGGQYKSYYDSGHKNFNDGDLVYNINNNSNLGFNFNYSRYSGVFELGISDPDSGSVVRVRKAYGKYKFKDYELLIGQTWSPYITYSHESADYYRSRGFGSMYEEPTLQIQMSIKGFYINIMKPNITMVEYSREVAVDNPPDEVEDEYNLETVEREITTKLGKDHIKSYFPKMALGYRLESKQYRFGAGLAGNMYMIANSDKDNYDQSIIYSYLAYLNAEAEYDKFIFAFSGGFLVNPANYGIAIQSEGNNKYPAGASQAIYNVATGKTDIKDTWNIQAFAECGYKIKESIKLYGGYGYSVMKYPVANSEYDMAMEYFLNMKIGIGGLLAVTPSISFRDYMDDMSGDDEGHEVIGGMLATISYY